MSTTSDSAANQYLASLPVAAASCSPTATYIVSPSCTAPAAPATRSSRRPQHHSKHQEVSWLTMSAAVIRLERFPAMRLIRPRCATTTPVSQEMRTHDTRLPNFPDFSSAGIPGGRVDTVPYWLSWWKADAGNARTRGWNDAKTAHPCT